ncbi:cell wall hydrolase [Novosphingobium terrae]|uniref:cell wall hydrolase n=1 Tax=Novosphingobium terrae TaxID=2726189 RepID=UPI00197D8582|nr:cell wall hydrolase [Novosphingobium terrae]
MKRLSVSRAMFALPVVALVTGLQPANSAAHAAGQQTEAPSAQVQSNSIQSDSDQPAPVQADVSAPIDTVVPDNGPNMRQVECVAKVIVHEAANQVHRGQVAVAQVIRARMKVAGTDACETVMKPGQFFNVNRYNPSRTGETWRKAVVIATQTLKGEGEEVVPGAMFFHTVGHPMHGRVQVAQIDDHVFYR